MLKRFIKVTRTGLTFPTKTTMAFIQKRYRVIPPKGNKGFQPHNTSPAATRVIQLERVPNLLLFVCAKVEIQKYIFELQPGK